MFSNYKYKKTAIILLLGLSLPQSSFALPRKNILTTCVELSFYLCFLSLVGHILDEICQFTPALSEQKNSDEKSLQSIEERAHELEFILKNLIDDELTHFRVSLIQHYEKILKSRSFSSIFFAQDVPSQPWALLNIEIQQHLDRLVSLRSKLFDKTFSQIETHSLSHEQALQFFDRIQKIEDLLIAIKIALQSLPSFQIECSQARQEKSLSDIKRTIGIFLGIYLIQVYTKYLDKCC